MYRSLYPYDVFSEIDRLQRDIQQTFNGSPSIRGLTQGAFPAMNVGGMAESVEIYAFTPGVDPARIEANIENGVLTIQGERKDSLSAQDDKATVHISERFSGRFRRVVRLPDDIDSNAVEAKCRNGVLHIRIKRREASQPRRITIH